MTYSPELIERLVREAREALERAHDLADQIEETRREVDHWREARRTAMEAGEVLKAELDAARTRIVELEERCDQLSVFKEILRCMDKGDRFDGDAIHRMLYPDESDAYRAAKGNQP